MNITYNKYAKCYYCREDLKVNCPVDMTVNEEGYMVVAHQSCMEKVKNE